MRNTNYKSLLVPLMLAGCNSLGEAASNGAHERSRFSGVGVYAPTGLWAEQLDFVKPADKSAAKLTDDDKIIVTVDGQTGEIRQCGNHSGHCVSLSAWEKGAKKAPLKLRNHAEDLSQESTLEPEPSAPYSSKN
jgi:hypothetical protein